MHSKSLFWCVFKVIEEIQKRNYKCEKKDRFFKQLSTQAARSIEFIDEFIDATTNIELFIKELCSYWQNIWSYIADESVYEDDKKEKYLKLILKFAPKENLKSIFRDHLPYLNNRTDFLKTIDDKEKLKEIIKTLGLEFVAIDTDSPASLLDYVYDEKNYDITIQTLEVFLNHKNKFDVGEFENSNYSAIINCTFTTLIDYVKDNLSDYIENVYLQLESNVNEPIDRYLELLNSDDLELSTIEEIIIQVNTKVEDLDLVSNHEIWNLLLENSKVEPNWENILLSYNKEEELISESLIIFLNDESNARLLSGDIIPTKVDDEDIYGKLCLSLIHCTKVCDLSYDFITQSIPWAYGSLSLTGINRNRANILINNGKINSTIKNFESLKEHHEGLNITLLERSLNKYIEKIDELSLDSNDIKFILESRLISSSNKNIFIEHCSADIITSNRDILKLLSEILLSDGSIKVNKAILSAVLLDEDIDTVNRVQLFIKNSVFEDDVSLDSFIETLTEEYADIANRNKKAVLANTELNEMFLGKLDLLDYISSVSKISKGLRVNHKRNW